MIWLPEVHHVISFHAKLIDAAGGSHGVRDKGLIESALMRANAAFDGNELYPSVVEKAAAICCGLISNHGFLDGNKRIGTATMLLVLLRNNVHLRFSEEELVELGMKTAQSTMDVESVTMWIREHTES